MTSVTLAQNTKIMITEATITIITRRVIRVRTTMANRSIGTHVTHSTRSAQLATINRQRLKRRRGSPVVAIPAADIPVQSGGVHLEISISVLSRLLLFIIAAGYSPRVSVGLSAKSEQLYYKLKIKIENSIDIDDYFIYIRILIII